MQPPITIDLASVTLLLLCCVFIAAPLIQCRTRLRCFARERQPKFDWPSAAETLAHAAPLSPTTPVHTRVRAACYRIRDQELKLICYHHHRLLRKKQHRIN